MSFSTEMEINKEEIVALAHDVVALAHDVAKMNTDLIKMNTDLIQLQKRDVIQTIEIFQLEALVDQLLKKQKATR